MKAWNLWWNAKLSDDPQVWDGEIKSINQMQCRLGELTADQRLIRAQIAEFCRFHPLFPVSVDILCGEIGVGRYSRSAKMGCEGRGLLDSLTGSDREGLNQQETRGLSELVRALGKWLVRDRPGSPKDLRTFGFLGDRTSGKEAFVKKLLSEVNPEEPSVTSLRNLCGNMCKETQRPLETLGFRPFNCFSCEQTTPGEAALPGCQCCYFMLIDAGLLCAGTSGEDRSMSDEFNRFIEEYVLAYAAAINSWLTEAPPAPIAPLATGHYVNDKQALGIADRLGFSLGEKDELKEWLAACLLKTIKDNQRWHEGSELIDDCPEVTSWLTHKGNYA